MYTNLHNFSDQNVITLVLDPMSHNYLQVQDKEESMRS